LDALSSFIRYPLFQINSSSGFEWQLKRTGAPGNWHECEAATQGRRYQYQHNQVNPPAQKKYKIVSASGN
jgi:hypothetical protein